MRPETDAWLVALPSELRAQRDALRRLVEAAESDDRIRLVVVGCSIGRGVGDALSDIDAYLGVAAASWPNFLTDVPSLAGMLGPVLDLRSEIFEAPAGTTRPYQHTFVQFRDGLQLDLVVAPAAPRAPGHDWVVLHDPDHLIGGEPIPGTATPDQVTGWMFNAFVRLSACAKYLNRGSLWEAAEMLHAARTDLWRLWATARSITDPQYGLAAVSDAAPVELPDGIEQTIAPLERAALSAAALACADLLLGVWPTAISAAGLPSAAAPAFATYVRAQLAARHQS